MKMGKHTAEAQKIKKLEETIDLKNREIKDIKTECAEQFKMIKELCFCNSYSGKLDKLSKIYEIASDNFSALITDIFIDDGIEKEQKIIELPNTNQSKK